MNNFHLWVGLFAVALGAFYFGRARAQNWRSSAQIHSLPNYYGYLAAFWAAAPTFLIFALWSFFERNIAFILVVAHFPDLQFLSAEDLQFARDKILAAPGDISDDPKMRLFLDYLAVSFNLKIFIMIMISALGFLFAARRINPATKARNQVERAVVYALFSCAAVAVLTTLGIIFSMLFESLEFFARVPIWDFIFGVEWSPQISIREDQVASSGAFGAVPIFWGTIFISFVAILIAGPLGLISAIYLAEYASPKIHTAAKPILEILAGIPTVVYGFFAALTVGPLVRDFGHWLKNIGVDLDIQILADLSVSTESVLAAGLVMGMMIVPFILSLSDDVISAVPSALRDGSTALGATHSETIFRVVLPAALPGIVGGFLLAISRAVGETMIVLMAASVAANLTANPFAAVTTVTTQIVVLLTGDQAFDSAKTLAAFALGLGLFITTLILNIIALYIVKKYREQYE